MSELKFYFDMLMSDKKQIERHIFSINAAISYIIIFGGRG